MLGCSISEATSVRSLLNNGTDKLQDVSQIMYPWSCLVCCRGFSKGNTNLPLRAFDFISGAFSRYMKEFDIPPYEKNRFIQERAPSYVYRILEGVRLSQEEWNEINVNRIIITYQNKEN